MPIIIYNDKFLNAISWFMIVGGISIFPFIILREKYRDGGEWWEKKAAETINHETIHFQQALELLIIPFYILYFLEYIIKSIIYLDVQEAYDNISFEREAYENDYNLNYLKKRKRYNWICRIIK